MSLRKALKAGDREALEFAIEQVQRLRRDKIERMVRDLVDDYRNGPTSLDSLQSNLFNALRTHVSDNAETFLRHYEDALVDHKKSLRLSSAIYRGTVMKIRDEKKWCHALVHRIAQTRGLADVFFENLLSDLRNDKSISAKLPGINAVKPKIQRRPVRVKVKSKRPLLKVTPRNTTDALTPEQLAGMRTVTQEQAARAFHVTETRTIRNLFLKGTLNKTEYGRVCRDDKFDVEYKKRNAAVQE